MTPNDVITHPDFKNLVKSALYKFGLVNSFRSLRIPLDDLYQEVALHILKGGIRKNITLLSNIYNHTKWCVMTLMTKGNTQRRLVNNNTERLNGDLQDKGFFGFKHVDDVDQLEDIEYKQHRLRVKDVLKRMCCETNMQYVADEIGISREGVRQIIKEVGLTSVE